jgi:hypothetical protein
MLELLLLPAKGKEEHVVPPVLLRLWVPMMNTYFKINLLSNPSGDVSAFFFYIATWNDFL